ncbi:MAG: protein YdeJ [Moraxellaceae bacterium]|jgi:nicotinamide-nucleotide amidase|nr:protein YdeJ [Moraxellaceae bacterium]
MSDVLTHLAARVGERLRERGEWLATAESCTGGGIAEAVTRIAGSSTWFERGWVTYSNAAKAEELGVDPAVIAAQGAVSEAVARAMADGARRRAGTAWALAVTGIAGPGGGSAEKPVGTVWLAWAGPAGTSAACRLFPGDRDTIRRATMESSLQRLHELLMLASPESDM